MRNYNKGITLIALVITIIVLLILAGIAISMLSGENGILTRASEAKTKTETASFIEQVRLATIAAMTNKEAKINEEDLIKELKKIEIAEENIVEDRDGGYIVKKDSNAANIKSNGTVSEIEEIKDTDIDLEKYFITNNLKYKCRYGYLTGFEYDREQGHTVETVAEVEAELPSGYKIISKYEFDRVNIEGKDVSLNEEEKNSTYISTGMVIAKDGQEVARTVLLGDVNCNGKFGSVDSVLLSRYLNFWLGYEQSLQDFQKVSCNVISDKILNCEEKQLLTHYISNWPDIEINQQQNIATSGKNLKRLYTKLQQYISLLNEEETGYKFEYNEEKDTYKLKGVKKGTTVESLISKLPDIYEIKVIEQTIDEENKLTSSEIASDAEVMNGYYIQLEWEYTDSEGATTTVKPRFAYIGVE